MGGQRRALLFRVAIAMLLAVVATGCGPFGYIKDVTRGAVREVRAATEARAELFAPYEYTLAVQYLRKAKEEAARSDLQAARRFGKKASQAARTARELALERALDPAAWEKQQPPPLPRGGS